MITIQQKGDFSKITRFLEKAKGTFHLSLLDKYGRQGVDALASATPVDTGTTADSWEYEVERTKEGATLSFYNTNTKNDGPYSVNIAILLQYGHGTRNGGWVQGRDYINPAIQPIFDQIAEEAWKEVMSV